MGSCFSLPFNAVGGLWAGPYLLDVQGLTREQASVGVLAMVVAYHLGNLAYGPVERMFDSRKWTVTGGVALMIGLLVVVAVSPGLAAGSAIVLMVLVCLFAPFYPVLAAHCRGFVPLSRAGRAISCVNLMGLTTLFAMQKLTGWMVELTAAPDGSTTLLGYRLAFATIALALAVALAGYLRVRDVPPA